MNISKLIKQASEWRQKNIADGHNYVGKGGVVVIFGSEVNGWVNELRNPESWRPGAVAIDEVGNVHIAAGGNDDDGAQWWQTILKADSDPQSKECTLCGETKPLSDFGINVRTNDGHNCSCKKCQRKVTAARRQAILDGYGCPIANEFIRGRFPVTEAC